MGKVCLSDHSITRTKVSTQLRANGVFAITLLGLLVLPVLPVLPLEPALVFVFAVQEDAPLPEEVPAGQTEQEEAPELE